MFLLMLKKNAPVLDRKQSERVLTSEVIMAGRRYLSLNPKRLVSAAHVNAEVQQNCHCDSLQLLDGHEPVVNED
jgi:hypothetical protein